MTSQAKCAIHFSTGSGTLPTAAACYVYDANGLRVQKTIGSSQTSYLYDLSGNVVAEDYGAGWAPGYVYAGGQLITEYKNGTTYFVHGNHLGSSSLLTSVAGAVVDCNAFYPFGEQDISICVTSNVTSHKFTGDERDTETNLDHTWFRQYTSAQGRWMTPDPAGLAAVDPTNPQSWNRYAYVLNDPLDFVDPLGLDDCGFTDPHVVDVYPSLPTWGDYYFWYGGIAGLGALGQVVTGGNGKCHDAQRHGGNGGNGGSGGNTQIVNGDGQSCVPSVFDPSCKPPSCPAVFIKSAGDAIDIPTLPSGPAPEDVARAATAAAVTRHIVNRGLVVPLRSSIVRNLFFWGETAADAVMVGPALFQATVGLKDEIKAWYNGKCTTIWSTSRVP